MSRSRRKGTACCFSRTRASARRACRTSRECVSACVRSGGRARKAFAKRPNLFVYSPSCCRCLFAARALDQSRRAAPVDAPLDARHRLLQPAIIWTFLPTPLTLDLIRDLDPQLTVYYCIDDFASSSIGAKRIVASEQALFETADLVLRHLGESARARRPAQRSVHVFPFSA